MKRLLITPPLLQAQRDVFTIAMAVVVAQPGLVPHHLCGEAKENIPEEKRFPESLLMESPQYCKNGVPLGT